jgi:hypothetical protein
MRLTIRARLTLLYCAVLAASFVAFFWICDYGFQRSIETTVNNASQNNLEIVKRVIGGSLTKGLPKVSKELTELSELWANGAIFEVQGPDGAWLFRSQRFLRSQIPLPAPPADGTAFLTTNLDFQQYRIAQEDVLLDGQHFQINAAVPTEPFDQALDNFRLIEQRFLPLLVILASLLGYWLSGRALAPVNRIIESAESIGVQNLSQRLPVPKARDELRRLTKPSMPCWPASNPRSIAFSNSLPTLLMICAHRLRSFAPMPSWPCVVRVPKPNTARRLSVSSEPLRKLRD